LLGEKHFETLVRRNLRLVGLPLAEVGINSNIGHQAVLQHKLGVKARIYGSAVASKVRVRRVALIDSAIRTKSRKGKELNVAAGGDVFQAGQRGFLIDTAFNTA